MSKRSEQKKKAIQEKLDRLKKTKSPEDVPFHDLQRDVPEIQKEESLDRIMRKK